MTKNTSKTIFSFLILGLLTQSFFHIRNTSAQESEIPSTETDGQESTPTESLGGNEGQVAGVETGTTVEEPSAPEVIPSETQNQAPQEEIVVLAPAEPVPPPVTVSEPNSPVATQPVVVKTTEEDKEEPENIISPIYIPPANIPKISVRPPERKIQIDPSADHSCRMENFTANMTSQNSLEKKIILTGSASTAKDIEVLGVPSGFKIKFKKNNQTKTSISAEQTTNILIEKMVTAQKGNFNVSFVFTEKGSKNSSIICQMNLINE